jgi:hypothetical protein
MNCDHCGEALPKPKRGQRQKFCTLRCRVAAHRQCVTEKEAHTAAVSLGLSDLSEDQLQGSRPALPGSPAAPRAEKLDCGEFRWRGLALCFGRREVLTLVQDDTYPHLYRIRYPGGWISAPANISRAKDAAYGHARYLLGQ